MYRRNIFISLVLLFVGLAWSRGEDATPTTTTNTTEKHDTQRTVTETTTIIREKETQVVDRKQEDAGKPLVAAVFVKNRAAEVPDAKVEVLEDFLTSKLTDRGFKIISREDAINSVKDFAKAGANRGDEKLPGADLDQILSNNTSAQWLAQNMGADYVLIASITACDTNVTDYNGNGIHTKIRETKMEVTYKLLDAGDAGSVSGDVVEATKKDRLTSDVNPGNVQIDDLLKKSGGMLADVLGHKAEARRIRLADAAKAGVDFTVACDNVDMKMPVEVAKQADGQYVIAKREPVGITAMVSLDGVGLGTAPNTFRAAKGVHKIRVHAPGFRDYEDTVSVQQGATLNLALQMTNEELTRWHDITAFLERIKDDSKLTDADVKVLEGYAQMLRQSGYRVDIKKDIKEDINSNTTGTLQQTTEIHQSVDAKSSTTAGPWQPAKP